MEKKRIKSYTLVEIMLVVGIIMLLTTISIPGIQRSRMNANQKAAVTSLYAVSMAAQSYRSVGSSYPNVLNDLGAAATPPYLDTVLACAAQPCSKQGYNFYIQNGDADEFAAIAFPQNCGSTGRKVYWVDETGVMRYSDNANCNLGQSWVGSDGTVLE
ncbi:MAG: type IV pilin protein [Candidatus Omnitrophota bacterium]